MSYRLSKFKETSSISLTSEFIDRCRDANHILTGSITAHSVSIPTSFSIDFYFHSVSINYKSLREYASLSAKLKPEISLSKGELRIRYPVPKGVYLAENTEDREEAIRYLTSAKIKII